MSLKLENEPLEGNFLYTKTWRNEIVSWRNISYQVDIDDCVECSLIAILCSLKLHFSTDLIAFEWASTPSFCSLRHWFFCLVWLRDHLKVLCKFWEICKFELEFVFFISIFFNCKEYIRWNKRNYFMYFSMNFLWNSDLNESLMNVSPLSTSVRAQFLNTTSSFHRRFNFTFPFGAADV